MVAVDLAATAVPVALVDLMESVAAREVEAAGRAHAVRAAQQVYREPAHLSKASKKPT